MKGLWDSTTIRSRFAVSMAANVLRAGAGLVAGVLVARGLGPSRYGDLAFLLGSFLAVRQLLDAGSSNAFYTFLSQRPRPRRFYLSYFGFLGLQFLVVLVLITVWLPRPMVQLLWLGHPTWTVVLAFAASFMQQQVWQTVVQVAEAERLTVRVQALGLATVVLHAVLLAFAMVSGLMTVTIVLALITVEYALATVGAFRIVRPRLHLADERPSLRSIVAGYVDYCSPLVLSSIAGFAYEFGDRWMLQHFGGATQQGFYQIGYQYSSASLIATTSILSIFWKEISEANERQDRERMRLLYQRISQRLLVFGAILSGFAVPWSETILVLLLSRTYAPAWPTLALMFFFPIHQTMGQVGGVMFLATGRTRIYVAYGLAFMLASLPISYLVQAPRDAAIPGLALGSTGMALKMVVLNIIGVNALAWLIGRTFRWKYQWVHQVVGVATFVVIGFLCKEAVVWIGGAQEGSAALLLVAASGVLYVVAVAAVLWTIPWLVALDRNDIRSALGRLWHASQGA